MSETRTPQADAGPALSFAERWADFTKACSIYPETNARVRAALETMLAALPAAIEAAQAGSATRLEICFFSAAMRVVGETRELASGTNLRWLHDRIHRTALAGVAFHSEATPDAVLAFTRRLLDLYGRRRLETSFEALWTESYPGLTLVDRRFAGTFGQAPDEADARVPSWGAGDTGALDLAPERPVAEALARNPQIQTAVESVRERLAVLTKGGESVREVDLVGRLARQMPRDVMHDPETVVRLALTALEELEQRLAQGVGDDAAALPVDALVTQLMFEASQGLLGRSDGALPLDPGAEEALSRVAVGPATAAPGTPPGPNARASDAAILDDPALFQAELARLPAPFSARLEVSTVRSPAEEVGVHLQFLADPAAQAQHAPARRILEALLARPGEAEAQVLREFLEARAGEDEAVARDRRQRILEFLRTSRLGRTLRRCGLLSTEQVQGAFPRDFGLYLDGLNPAEPGDMRELSALASALGRERILDRRKELVGTEQLLDPVRVERLLVASGPPMLPFLRLVLESGSEDQRARTLAALRKMRADEEGACLLFVVDRPELLPRPYLIALTDAVPGQENPARFREEIGSVIARYLEATAQDASRTPRRVYAIRHLVRYLTPEARGALTNILRRRRWLLFPREPKAVRDAARDALKAARTTA